MENETFFVIREQTPEVDRLEDEAASLWSQLTDFGYDKDNASVMSRVLPSCPTALTRLPRHWQRTMARQSSLSLAMV